MSEANSVDLYTPVVCAHCPSPHILVSLTVELPRGMEAEAFEAGTLALAALAYLNAMRHVRDEHPNQFVDTFGRFPEDAIPEAEAVLRDAGVDYGETIAYSAGGTISTPINYN